MDVKIQQKKRKSSRRGTETEKNAGKIADESRSGSCGETLKPVICSLNGHGPGGGKDSAGDIPRALSALAVIAPWQKKISGRAMNPMPEALL